MKERWRKIPGFPCYSASSLGKIRNNASKYIFNPKPTLSGYKRVTIKNSKKRRTSMLIHRLVAFAFLRKRDVAYTVDHINRVRTDNRACNLRWISHSSQNKNRIIQNSKKNVLQFSRGRILMNKLTMTPFRVCKRKYTKVKGCLWRIESNFRIPNETWKPYGNIHVSDKGRILIKNRKVFGSPCGSGYLKINLIKKSYFVHRIIAQTFIDNPDNKPMVNHKDRNKYNNNVENLEWVTALENSHHYWKTKNKI